MARAAANFTIHRCNTPCRTPAKTAVFEQLQPASKQFLILLLFPRCCPQNCCKLVLLFHYKETKGSLCLSIIIRLLDAFLFCDYIYSRISNSVVYRNKVTMCSLRVFLSYKQCKTPLTSLEFATERINPF